MRARRARSHPHSHAPGAEAVEPGQTILLPTFKLSDVRPPRSRGGSPVPPALTRPPLAQRDREILKGIAPTGARTYPMRAGEKLSEVLKGRGVTMAEAQALNPGVDLAKVKDGQLVKLPYGRYTQREKEMLSSVVPATSLGLPSTVSFSQAQLQFGLLAALAVAAYSFYVKQAAAWSERQDE